MGCGYKHACRHNLSGCKIKKNKESRSKAHSEAGNLLIYDHYAIGCEQADKRISDECLRQFWRKQSAE